MTWTYTQNRIVQAYSKGYRVDGGKLIGPKGELSLKLYGKQRYPTFSTNWDRKVYGVPVHKFAYCYYGVKSFDKGLVVRHKDGNTLNISEDNILLGTHSENNMDKPGEARVSAAKAARAAQGTLPNNALLSENDVKCIRDKYSKLKTKKAPNGFTAKLAKELGVCKAVIYNVAKGKTYASYTD